MTPSPKYVPTPTGFLMVLTEGDDVFANLESLVRAERFGGAALSGFGFAKSVTFGFFNFDKRAYDPSTFESCEIASMTGTLAWKDGQPSIHAHGVACDNTFAAHGGHLLTLEVGKGSVEITVTVLRGADERLVRTMDASIGANILRLGDIA